MSAANGAGSREAGAGGGAAKGAGGGDRAVMLTPERVAAAAASGYWPDRTAGDYLDEALRDRPDKVFVTDYKAEAGTRTSLSYRELDRLSRRHRRRARRARHRQGRGGGVPAPELVGVRRDPPGVCAHRGDLEPLDADLPGARARVHALVRGDPRAVRPAPVPRVRLRADDRAPAREASPPRTRLRARGAGRERLRGDLPSSGGGRTRRTPAPSSRSGAPARTRSSRSATPRAPPGSRRG